MATKKATKAVKTYTATWNKRDNGQVTAVSEKVTKKGNKYYTADGNEVPSWATITEK